MAPFSVCSQCNQRTRKIVRDPKTRKNIYLCPKCAKTREERALQKAEEHKELQRAQLEAEMVQLKKPKEEVKVATTESPSLALASPRAKTLATPPALPLSTPPDKKLASSPAKTPAIPPDKTLASPPKNPAIPPRTTLATLLATRCNAPLLQTPPIMQTVVIKGRKYLAVSATASNT